MPGRVAEGRKAHGQGIASGSARDEGDKPVADPQRNQGRNLFGQPRLFSRGGAVARIHSRALAQRATLLGRDPAPATLKSAPSNLGIGEAVLHQHPRDARTVPRRSAAIEKRVAKATTSRDCARQVAVPKSAGNLKHSSRADGFAQIKARISA